MTRTVPVRPRPPTITPGPASSLLLAVLVVSFAGCPSPEGGDDDGQPLPEPVAATLENAGDSDWEGHTPRGFQGMGTGLFAGDDINPSFPDGDGVQVFLSFDVSELPAGDLLSAELRAADVEIQGSPFSDLGDLHVERVRFDTFSSALWDLDPEAEPGCVLASDEDDAFACDLAEATAAAVAAGTGYAQFRVRFEEAGDGDGEPDLAVFNPDDSNENRPGLFTLEIAVRPEGEIAP